MKPGSTRVFLEDEELAALLVRLQTANDRDALEKILDLTQEYVYALARQRISDHTEALDVCQKVFLEFVRQHKMIRNARALRGWLRSVVNGYASKAVKRRGRDPLDSEMADLLDNIPATVPTPLEILLHKECAAETAVAMHRALARLPSRYRECIELLCLSESTPASVADQLHIAKNSVYEYKARALMLLAAQPEIKALYEKLYF